MQRLFFVWQVLLDDVYLIKMNPPPPPMKQPDNSNRNIAINRYNERCWPIGEKPIYRTGTSFD